MTIISLKEAQQQGLKRYFNGKPCKWGHVEERMTSSHACLGCMRTREAKWRRDNPDKSKARKRKSYYKNPEKSRADNRKWYKANADKYAEKSRERARQWVKDNPERFRENNRVTSRNRRARERHAIGRHTAADIAAILLRQGRRCLYCKAPVKKVGCHVDHIVPLSKGGTNGPENLQILCPPCNRGKGSKSPEEYARKHGLLL